MRKLSLVAIVALFSLIGTAAFAQEEVTETVTVEAVQEKVEVEISDLPEAVTKTLADAYTDYTAEKAYKTTIEEKEVFYITISKDGESKEVVINADGTVVE